MITVALFEPEIPQNTGNILRTADCFNAHVDIIEPCGFIWGSQHMKRSAMDYLQHVDYQLHASWEHFLQQITKSAKNIIIATTKTQKPYYEHQFQPNDVVLFGQESKGLPDDIMLQYPKITIPMRQEARSLNLAISVAIILAEASKQLSK